MAQIIVFDFKFNNPQMEKEFKDFFHENGLDPLFTNEHRSSPISVSYAEARSVINREEHVKGKSGRTWKRKEGANVKTLQDFADFYLTVATNNKKYEQAILKIIDNSRSFQGLMNNIKKVMEYTDSIEEKKKFNRWNIVYYHKELL